MHHDATMFRMSGDSLGKAGEWPLSASSSWLASILRSSRIQITTTQPIDIWAAAILVGGAGCQSLVVRSSSRREVVAAAAAGAGAGAVAVAVAVAAGVGAAAGVGVAAAAAGAEKE